MIEYLETQLNLNGIEFDDNKIKALMLYHDMLYKANETMNLTRIPSGRDAIDKHFIDSLIALKSCDMHKKHIIDIGTGAGLPGIPLAIFLYDSEFLLIDSLNKRIKFIQEVIQALEIKNVNLLHARAEEAGRNPLYREKYDIAVSRALSSLPILCEYMLPFVRIGGMAIAYKGNLSNDEISDSKNSMKVMGSDNYHIYDVDIDGKDFMRKLVFIHKDRPTPIRYPRKATNIVKKPLI